MHIVVFGATGGTGREVVQQALAQGHTVKAFVRDPDKLAIEHEHLVLFQGDIRDENAVSQAIKGTDAVVSTLGVNNLRKNSILSDGTRNIITAMEKNKVKRFVCQTTIGLGESRKQVDFIWNYILIPYVLSNTMRDKERQERYIMESKLDWVIVRPGGLTDDGKTGSYRHGFAPDDKSIQLRISRADVADFMLKQLTDTTYLRQAVGISY
jgi:putative NADH-flavin reductase